MTGEPAVENVAGQTDLSDLIASLADNKHLLGRRYAEWCTAAPSLESAVAAAAMAQDEIGHARSLYPVLKEIVLDAGGAPSPELEPETRTAFVYAPFLRAPFESWTDFVAANFLFDTAVSVLLESATNSSFGPLAQRARRILQEEQLHWLHGEGWVRRLAHRGPGVRRALSASLSAVGPQSLEWFAVATPALVDSGVLSLGSPELQSAFAERVNASLIASNLGAL